MILIIDNYDSFTYNLVQQIEACGYDTAVYKNDEISLQDITTLRPQAIVISPGPGSPADAGISCDVVREFSPHIPILGVCLGYQCIGTVFGATLTHAKHIMHGKTSVVHHTGDGIFTTIPHNFTVARYHSLALANVSSPLAATATADDGEIMALQHESLPIFGVQFHPESFLSEHGNTLMGNFLHASTH